MFIDKLKVVPYVETDEACKLSKFRTIHDIHIAKEIYGYYIKVYSNERSLYDAFLSAIGIIWNAGRIQGIREERIKKRKAQRG